MKAILLTVGVLLISASALAQGPCENFAKFGAIRHYKSIMGTVQGSEGIEYSSKFIGTQGNISDYVVTIVDNNEDGEMWEVDYSVQVQDTGKKCKVLAVKQIDAR